MLSTRLALSLLISAIASACVALEPAKVPLTQVVLAQDVEWTPLNPARGDKGPQAGTLWGDQTGDGASGFLVKFVDGFSSPPHIHNITYRGVVIGGLLHNDDPGAASMWMPAGSYWTQPAGEVHITAARGVSVAYVEIQEGPYLVMPPAKAFDDGDRPVNVDASNLVWLNAVDTAWIIRIADGPPAGDEAEIAFLWGRREPGELNGSFVKLPSRFQGEIRGEGSTLRCVVIEGGVQHQATGQSDTQALQPGSYFGSSGEVTHAVSADEKSGCLLYVRAKGRFMVAPGPRSSE